MAALEGFYAMSQVNGAGVCQAERWWRLGRLAGVAVGLLLVKRQLVREVGSPMTLARTLGALGDPWADPVASVLALMALTAEALIGYLLVVLALRALGTVPGLTGHVARRIALAVTPSVVRRLVDLLVGGTLLVQVTLAAPVAVPGHRSSGPFQTMAAASSISRPPEPAGAGDLELVGLEATRLRRPTGASDLERLRLEATPVRRPTDKEPVRARPTLRRSAAPLPPWLGGGPSKAAQGHRAAGDYIVEAGDTLWDIAAVHLVPAERSAATIHRYWRQVYRANRPVVGADPDVIHPGARLDVVPYRRDHR